MLVAKVYEHFSVMVSENDCKYCNVIESYKTVFQMFQDYFPILLKGVLLVLLQGCFKRLAFNSSAIMRYVMKTENIKL